MGNLFLKHKENWWLWLFWGVIGCSLSSMALTYTSEIKLSLVAIVVFLSIVTFWLNYSKRYDFSCAFKVLFFISLFSLFPVLIDQAMPMPDMSKLAVDSLFLLLAVTSICVLCAWLAKRPKQYY